MSFQSYKDLEIYQTAHPLAVEIHTMTTKKLPKLEKYEEGGQIRKSSKSSIQDPASRIQQKGQALFFVLFVLAVFGALAGGLTVMWESEILTRSSDRDSLIAFYLAQAGIENAKIWARDNPSGPFPSTSGPITLGGGRYNYTVTNPGGVNRDIVSVGQTLDASLNPIAERQISLQVTNIETPNTDITNDAQAPWSWREI